MHKVTRSSLKALQTTLPFGSKQLILSNSTSSLNNYPAPLTNNITMKNFFAVKCYSTSTLLADNNTTPTTLDPTLFKKWTKEEVCSILCSAEGKGGAGLTFEKVKLLYDAGFDGTSIANIISTIKEDGEKDAVDDCLKSFPIVPRDTMVSVVNWVDNLLKTRLYHLWSAEQAKEQLCKTVEEGGACLSDTRLNGSFLQKLRKGALDELTNFEPSDRNLIMAWIEGNKLVPSFTSTRFNPTPCIDLPYQNNKNSVKFIANTLLGNKKRKMANLPIIYQQLLVNSAYFGSGKTRLGLEFLSLWKKQMDDSPSSREEYCQTYGEENVVDLQNSKIVYIDCRNESIIDNDLAKTLVNIKNEISLFIGGNISNTPCYIVIDEIGSWATSYKPTLIQGISPYFSSMYEILHKFILPLQAIPTVSLYVCGKGAYLDIIGKLRTNYQSPIEVTSIYLEALTKDNIRKALTESKLIQFANTVEHFTSLEFVDYFIDQIYKETQGVPYYIVKYLLYEGWTQCKTSQDIDRTMKLVRSSISDIFKKPFAQFPQHPVLMGIYQSLLYSSILKLDFNSTLFNREWITVDKLGSEFEGINSLESFTTASMLNCFVQPKPNGKYELLFPQAVIDEFTKSSNTPNILLISSIVEKFGPMLSLGDLFERLAILNFVFRMKWGSLQGFGIGEVIPFLKDTDVGNVKCSELLPLDLDMKLVDNTNTTAQWTEVLLKLDWNRLGIFKDQSHSCDKIWKIRVENGQCVYVMIQDKNAKEYPKANFLLDIEKNEKSGELGQ